MKNKLMFGVLVKNYDEAIDFYTKKLGFVVLEDNPMGDDRWVTLTLPGNDGCVIALHVARTKDDQALLGKQGGSYPYFGMETNDCLGDYQRMKKLGRNRNALTQAHPFGFEFSISPFLGSQYRPLSRNGRRKRTAQAATDSR